MKELPIEINIEAEPGKASNGNTANALYDYITYDNGLNNQGNFLAFM